MIQPVTQTVWTESGWALKLKCEHMAMAPHESAVFDGTTWYAAPPKKVECDQCEAAKHIDTASKPSYPSRSTRPRYPRRPAEPRRPMAIYGSPPPMKTPK